MTQTRVAAPAVKAPATRPAPARPIGPAQVSVSVRSGETLEAAVQRTGVAPAEAQDAVRTLASVFDIARIRAGLTLAATVERPGDPRQPTRLSRLFLRTSPTSTATLTRAAGGGFRVDQTHETVRDETQVAAGAMRGSLYESAEAAGATPTLTAQVVKLFAHKLDFARDIHVGDEFRMVFDRKVAGSGRTVQTGDLLYAEIGAKGQVTRFYRFQPKGGPAEYFDALGKNIKGLLLRTPVDSTRITSGFGMRMHPILGYTRMHQGIDFGVPSGTPVYAAGDGTVEEARWAGGYGRFLKLRHAGGWETAYGHLSGWAVRPGAHVRQGQVIAYSGSTGESTGPHLHYEVIKAGVKINPKGVNVPGGTVLSGRDLAKFRIEKAHIDALLANAAGQPKLARASLVRTGGGAAHGRAG